MEKLACVIVTYRRKEALAENVRSTFSQRLSPDLVVIVDNYGKDGVKKHLKKSGTDVGKMVFIDPEKNVGGAGGFELGLKKAFLLGYDWFILMDDDGKPWGNDCFFELLNGAKEDGLTPSDCVFYNALVLSSEERLAFGLGHIRRLSEIRETDKKSGGLLGAVNPFNGTLLSRGLVEKIGFPNGAFFIKGDEVDYENRAKRAGARVKTVLSALYYHPEVTGGRKCKWFGREIYLYIEAPWKEYYSVRNYVYSTLRNGEKSKRAKRAAFLYKCKRLYAASVLDCPKRATKRMIKLGYKHGKKGILGATFLP